MWNIVVIYYDYASRHIDYTFNLIFDCASDLFIDFLIRQIQLKI